MDDTVRSSWRHGELDGNDLTLYFYRHEIKSNNLNGPKVRLHRELLPLGVVTCRVQLAVCWELRVSGGTRLNLRQ